MPNTYTPRAGTLPALLLEFFAANSEEELTPADVAVKFNRAKTGISQSLSQAVGAGLIVCQVNSDGDVVYRAAPRNCDALGVCQASAGDCASCATTHRSTTTTAATAKAKPKAAPPAPRTVWAQPTTTKARSAAPRARKPQVALADMVDVEALPVLQGTPPPPISQKGKSKYDRLFAKLGAPGTGVVIPIALRSTISAHITKLHRDAGTRGPRYRLVSAGDTAQLWRVA